MATKNEQAGTASTNDVSERSLTLSRTLNAPIALVWEVWTNPDHIKNWWGPNGFTNTISKMEVKPQGEWDLVMHGPDGTDYKNKSIFLEVVKHKKLVYAHVSAPKFTATIEFAGQGNKTDLKWHMLFETKEEFIQVVKTFKADEGLKQNVEKLGEYLKGDAFSHFFKTPDEETKTVTIERLLNAPRELVFKAFTDPEMLTNWWGPHGFTNSGCETDPKPGGKWQICMDAPQFPDHWCKGIFVEVTPPERLVFTTRAFIGEDGASKLETLNTIVLAEHNGKTKLTLTATVTQAAPEVAMSVNGMEEGWSQSIDRLNAYIQMGHNIRRELKTTKGARVCTYLNFSKNTEEALNFYKSVFKTEFHGGGIQRFGDAPPAVQQQLSEDDKKLVLHAELPILGGHVLMATDAPESMGFKLTAGNNMHISLEPETREEARRIFDALGEGGNITMPLQDMFFGSYFGSCTDKYGINWMVNHSEPK